MIKARLKTINGTRVYLIGLSDENVKRLKAGQPIQFDAKDIGIPEGGQVLIVHGTTEQEIAKEFNLPTIQ